jgi:hypothetical protein
MAFSRSALPETGVTVYSGHMGDTCLLEGRGHALEGVSHHGRAAPIRRPPARRREDGRALREFGISRKTGYKIYDRYKDCGVQGLTDRSRRPYRQANQLPAAIEAWIVRLKKEYPTWGAPKIRERLRDRCPDVRCPAISTAHAVLDRHGLVTRRRRRRHRPEGTTLSQPVQPNDL